MADLKKFAFLVIVLLVTGCSFNEEKQSDKETVCAEMESGIPVKMFNTICKGDDLHGILDFYGSDEPFDSHHHDWIWKIFFAQSTKRNQSGIWIQNQSVDEEPGYLGICTSILRQNLVCLRNGAIACIGYSDVCCDWEK